MEIVEFNNKKIRRIEYKGEWYFSVVDIVGVLVETTAKDKGSYWRKLKERLILEGGDQSVTNCHGFKLLAEDGKMRKTDCANLETLFRIIQSIPSPKAEPIKRWLAKVGYERIQEIENPEIAQERMMEIYKQKGYDEAWIHRRIQSIKNRKELTNEWDVRGAAKKDYEIFTAIMSKETFGIKPSEHKRIKGLKKENLRDNMTETELVLTMLGEITAKELHKARDTRGKSELLMDVREAGEVAGKTRKDIESRTGQKVVSSNNYLPKQVKNVNNLEIADNKDAKNTKKLLKNNKKEIS
jgi:prophage antirepressor-like protein